jgi:hypothetical protein
MFKMNEASGWLLYRLLMSCTHDKLYSTSTLAHVQGVLGNKLAGQYNLKTVQIREMMWK